MVTQDDINNLRKGDQILVRMNVDWAEEGLVSAHFGDERYSSKSISTNWIYGVAQQAFVVGDHVEVWGLELPHEVRAIDGDCALVVSVEGFYRAAYLSDLTRLPPKLPEAPDMPAEAAPREAAE